MKKPKAVSKKRRKTFKVEFDKDGFTVWMQAGRQDRRIIIDASMFVEDGLVCLTKRHNKLDGDLTFKRVESGISYKAYEIRQ